ncbi:hypothetical protein T01_586 [Trichinella spiralis]|uniref:Uncharacterized protein n=1 Tax=Trichinella spiralis TaxID=6334 RepID=A0A0V1BC01_TRISP|nr:hypothetical protein T01_586 [Trichinella spiralis]
MARNIQVCANSRGQQVTLKAEISAVQYYIYSTDDACIPRQTNAYVSNKWPPKLPCAYLNTQGSGPFENPLKRIDGG